MCVCVCVCVCGQTDTKKITGAFGEYANVPKNNVLLGNHVDLLKQKMSHKYSKLLMHLFV